MKITEYILYSFVLILLMFTMATYVNVKQAKKVKSNSEYVAHSGNVIMKATRFQRNMLNMVSGLRGFLLTGERYFIESYDTASAENQILLKELSVLIPANSIQGKWFDEIIKLNNTWVVNFAEPLREAKMLSIVDDSNLDYYKNLYRQKIVTGDERNIQKALQEKFRDFTRYEYEMRNVQKEQLASSVLSTRNLSFLLTALSILLSLFIIVFLTYRVSSRIRGMVTLANEIAFGNYTVTIEDHHKDELSKLSGSLNRMSKALSENIIKLQQKNQELDQFAHIVSHDLKGPLRGIDNVVTWIEEDHHQEISPGISNYLQLIKGRVTRAENLIEGLLSYARIGKEVMTKERVDINVLVREILGDVDAGVALRFFPERNMPVLFTERLPLLQVFSNLINNAIKHHDKPGGEIRIYHTDRGPYYEFTVEDNGPGIASHYHERIFGMFQTLKDRDSFESTGVGLAIVKKILNDRKESINVISSPGKGSAFSFTWNK